MKRQIKTKLKVILLGNLEPGETFIRFEECSKCRCIYQKISKEEYRVYSLCSFCKRYFGDDLSTPYYDVYYNLDVIKV